MCYCPMDDDEGRWVDVVVPAYGEAVSTAFLVVWWVELGQPTVRGEPLFEVGTEKTVFQVPAEVDGVLAEVRVPRGETVTPGLVVGRIRPD
ncbi:MAG: biotin/lipoyl-containing protein [Deferrisomatales bacterium]